MSFLERVVLLSLLLSVAVTGCASPGGLNAGGGEAAPTKGPKRITAALEGMLLNFGSDEKGPAGEGPFMGLVHGGLYVRDTFNSELPHLAEAIPSQENGLWKLFPDGRMEVTWRIREDARWLLP